MFPIQDDVKAHTQRVTVMPLESTNVRTARIMQMHRVQSRIYGAAAMFGCRTLASFGYVALIVAGCAPLRLTPQGSQVRLVTNPPSDIFENFSELGTVACTRGGNARELVSNGVQCQNELRNKTGALAKT